MSSDMFEQQLKQLRPAGCDDRMADTFYQSGWDACEKSLSTGNHHVNGWRRAMPTFSTGLACGFVLSLTAFLWSPNSDDTGQPAIAQQPAAPNGEEQIEGSSDNEPTSQRPTMAVTETSGRSWEIDDLLVASPISVEQFSPLSPAARNGWSAQLQASSYPSMAVDATEKTERKTLTSSPLNERIFNELML